MKALFGILIMFLVQSLVFSQYCMPNGLSKVQQCNNQSCIQCNDDLSCDGDAVCMQIVDCGDDGNYCPGKIPPYQPNRTYVGQYGWCHQPDVFIINDCQMCSPCNEIHQCISDPAAACIEALNCQDFNTLCGDKNVPPPQIQWCRPSTTDWMYSSCSQCVKSENFGQNCPDKIPYQSMYCNNWNTKCSINNIPPTNKTWCKPANSWLYDSCDQCIESENNGANCPDQQDYKAMNCGKEDFSEFCQVGKTELKVVKFLRKIFNF